MAFDPNIVFFTAYVNESPENLKNKNKFSLTLACQQFVYVFMYNNP